MKSKAYKIALGAIIMALCCIFMLATTVFPFASFAFPAIAGVLLIFLNIEFGKGWALLVYAGVALLSFILSSDHTAVISFAVFFGYYPILKGVIENLRKPVLEWLIKILTFNLAILVGVFLTILLFGKEILLMEYSQFGKAGLIAFIGACEVVFVVFDIALTRLISFAVNYILPRFKKLK